MRQATVTLLTLVIECQPNAAAFVASPATADLLTRFLPSCGDFNCQVRCLLPTAAHSCALVLKLSVTPLDLIDQALI